MGRGQGKFLIGREKYVACVVFLILMGVIHWTASNPTYLANSFALFRGWSRQAILAYMTINEDEQQNPKNQMQDSDLQTREKPGELSGQSDNRDAIPRVAICLVGGARAFELTALTIKKYVLDVYEDADIFLHVPVDEDTHKLTLLRNASNLAMARIFIPAHIPENQVQQEVLTRANSPNGIQLKLVRQGAQVAAAGAVVGRLTSVAIAMRYPKHPFGAFMSFVGGAAASWAMAEEGANFALCLYKSLETNF